MSAAVQINDADEYCVRSFNVGVAETVVPEATTVVCPAPICAISMRCPTDKFKEPSTVKLFAVATVMVISFPASAVKSV